MLPLHMSTHVASICSSVGAKRARIGPLSSMSTSYMGGQFVFGNRKEGACGVLTHPIIVFLFHVRLGQFRSFRSFTQTFSR